MAIRGSLEEASVPDVLQLLSLGRKTGRLSVTDWSSLGYIYVDSGKICYATIVNRRDRLGDVLVKSGKITQSQLEEAVSRQDRDRGKRLGQILVDTGSLTRDELERHMRTQIEEAVYFLFTWRRGNFTFESDVRPEDRDFLVSIDPESLLLEGARRTDEWSLIEAKVPSFGIVFQLDQERYEASQADVSAEQKRIAELLDGTRDVGEVVDATGIGEFDVGKALYGLVTAGLAHPVASKEADRQLSASGVRIDQEHARSPTPAGAHRHLDNAQLLSYVTRGGEYSDPGRRREAAFHIADCGTCSRRLKEIHKKRKGESEAGQPAAGDEPVATQPVAEARERRSGIDRRESGKRPAARTEPERRKPRRRSSGSRRRPPVKGETAAGAAVGRDRGAERRTGIDRRGSGERPRLSGGAGGGAPAPQAPMWAAVPQPAHRDRRSGLDRRCWVERRRRERRVRERRGSGPAVGRSDKFTVERRSGLDRRRADRRVVPRREADVLGPQDGSQTSWAAVASRLAATGVTAPPPAAKRRATTEPNGGERPEQSHDVESPPVARQPEPRRTEPGTSARAERPKSEKAGPVVVSKEQSATLTTVRPEPRPAPPGGSAPARTTAPKAPSAAPRLLESERQSLAGLPLLEVPGVDLQLESSPKAPAAKPEQQAGSAPTVPETPRRPAAAADTVRSESPEPEPAAAQGPLPARRTAPRPRPREAQAGPAPPPRAAERGPESGTSGRRSAVARVLGVAVTGIAVLALAWFGRPVVQSLWGGGNEGGGPGPPEAAAARVTPMAAPGQAIVAAPDTSTPDSEPVGAAEVSAPPEPTQAASARDTGRVEAGTQERAPPPPPAPSEVVQEPVGRARARAQEPEVRQPEPEPTPQVPGDTTPPPEQVAPQVPPEVVPVVGTLAGTVRSSADGSPLAGARVTLSGAGLAATSNAAGSYQITGVPAGSLQVVAELEGYLTRRRDVMVAAGSTVTLDLMLAGPPPAREPDPGLADGQWVATDRVDATSVLGYPIAVIEGLWIESVARPAGGNRPRVRVAQLTEGGDRIVLVEARSGPANRAATPRVTALRIIPPTEAYPITTGTASFGNLLVTAKTGLPADALRTLLGRLTEWSDSNGR